MDYDDLFGGKNVRRCALCRQALHEKERVCFTPDDSFLCLDCGIRAAKSQISEKQEEKFAKEIISMQKLGTLSIENVYELIEDMDDVYDDEATALAKEWEVSLDRYGYPTID